MTSGRLPSYNRDGASLTDNMRAIMIEVAYQVSLEIRGIAA